VTEPISSVGRTGGANRTRPGRGTSAPARVAAPEGVAPAAPIPPLSSDALPPPVAVSAQIMGQSDAAESDPPAKTAQRARAVYLGVEWSGKADRRTRRGRIAKTDI